ncbi:MAG: LPS assembly lipoprotein LptE [Verrucomicrobiota bacterium]|nr:LPS assembly lipoprotein LptE [Verrucomicrobiota bacterium]
MNRIFPIFILALCTIGFSGCASYKLGHGGQTQFSSIYVVPIKNASFAPQAAPIVGRTLIQAIAGRGETAIASEEQAGAVLVVTLVDYSRRTTTNRIDDTGRGLGTRLTLRATATLTNQKTSEVIFKDRIFEAEATAYDVAGGTLNDAEYGTLTNLADNLSSKIADAVTSDW